MDPMVVAYILGGNGYSLTLYCPDPVTVYYSPDLNIILGENLNEQVIYTLLVYMKLKEVGKSLSFPSRTTIASLISLRATLSDVKGSEQLRIWLNRLIEKLESVSSFLEKFARHPECNFVDIDYSEELNNVYREMINLLPNAPYDRGDAEILYYTGISDLKKLKEVFDIDPTPYYGNYLRSMERYEELLNMKREMEGKIQINGKQFENIHEAVSFLLSSGYLSRDLEQLYNTFVSYLEAGRLEDAYNIFNQLKSKLRLPKEEKEEDFTKSASLILLIILAVLFIWLKYRKRGKDEEGYIFTVGGDDLFS